MLLVSAHPRLGHACGPIRHRVHRSDYVVWHPTQRSEHVDLARPHERGLSQSGESPPNLNGHGASQSDLGLGWNDVESRRGPVGDLLSFLDVPRCPLRKIREKDEGEGCKLTSIVLPPPSMRFECYTTRFGETARVRWRFFSTLARIARTRRREGRNFIFGQNDEF